MPVTRRGLSELGAFERVRVQQALVERYCEELVSERSYRGVERLVQLVLQALLDFAAMAVSALGAGVPEGLSDLGFALHKEGLLGLEEAFTLKSMAELRDALLHGYVYIDRGRVLEYSKTVCRDAKNIAEKILGGLSEGGVDPPVQVEGYDAIRRVVEGRVVLAYLFGGRAKGYALRGDYDVAVLFEGGCDLLRLGELQVAISEGLGVGEELVDVVCLDSLPPRLALEVLRTGVPLVEDPVARLEFEARILGELMDLEVTRRLCRAF